MKTKILAAIVLSLCVPAFATDYTFDCGLQSVCYLGAFPSKTLTFSDTNTITLRDWDTPQGVERYTSTTDVQVHGGRFCASSGHPYPTCSLLIIDSATVDGVPMTPPVSGYTWTMGISLSPGVHVIAVSGHSTGLPIGNWLGRVDGVTYTLE